MKNIARAIAFALLFLISSSAMAQVDYSIVAVPEETGLELTKMTTQSDAVCMPDVKRSGNKVKWFSNRVLAPVPGSNEMGYLSFRNNSTNVFLKDMLKQGASRQRTNRSSVIDFSFSPDGKNLYFSEARGKVNQIFCTDAANGYVCRQITSGASDFSPVALADGSQVFFTRLENRGSSIWSHNVKNNFLSSYSSGYNPYPVAKQSALIVVRQTPDGKSELWKINYNTGVEECIVADPVRNFTTPSISPDGNWMVFVGSSALPTPSGGVYPNTDIFVSRLDGTDLRQLTYHAADDLSPVWSNDGKYIYFISQRGDAEATANIWRMTFSEK